MPEHSHRRAAETDDAPAAETDDAPAAETDDEPVAETDDAPAAERRVTSGGSRRPTTAAESPRLPADRHDASSEDRARTSPSDARARRGSRARERLERERRLDEVATAQHGLVTSAQATAFLGPHGARLAVSRHRLVSLGWGVYRCAGVAPSAELVLRSACLWYGEDAAVSHTSAAVLWGFEAVAPPATAHVTVAGRRSGRWPGVRTHRAELRPGERTLHRGLPVTSVPRTLLDVAPLLPVAVLERCIDDALRSRLVQAERLLGWLDERRPGRQAGAAHLHRLVERRVGRGVGDSAAVDRVLRWMARAGLPVPVCDFVVDLPTGVARLDLAYPSERVAVEFNGWEHHQMRSRSDRDHARTSELELAGWIVLVVTAAHGERATVGRIGRALRLQRRRAVPPGP